MREPIILGAGACCYATMLKDGRFEIRVFSTNWVTHVAAGIVDSSLKAATICERLNAYPEKTRRFHGLL